MNIPRGPDRPMIAVDDADALMARALGDRRTKLGDLLVDHSRRVAARLGDGADERLVVTALLHDVVEKSDTALDELRDTVGDDRVVELVDILTKRPGETHRAYLARCAADPDALLLKRLDLEDKLRFDPTDAPDDAVARVRRKATRRLATLEELAGG